jgi:hypothetical protein
MSYTTNYSKNLRNIFEKYGEKFLRLSRKIHEKYVWNCFTCFQKLL